jgi:hypothetical protein
LVDDFVLDEQEGNDLRMRKSHASSPESLDEIRQMFFAAPWLSAIGRSEFAFAVCGEAAWIVEGSGLRVEGDELG